MTDQTTLVNSVGALPNVIVLCTPAIDFPCRSTILKVLATCGCVQGLDGCVKTCVEFLGTMVLGVCGCLSLVWLLLGVMLSVRPPTMLCMRHRGYSRKNQFCTNCRVTVITQLILHAQERIFNHLHYRSDPAIVNSSCSCMEET